MSTPYAVNPGDLIEANHLNRLNEVVEGLVGNSLLFGDGSDGEETFSSDSELTEDKYYENLTVEEYVTVATNVFRIHVSGTFTNHGTVHADGGNAQNSSGSSVGDAGSGCGGVEDNVSWQGPDGGEGSLQSGATPGSPDNTCFLAAGGNGGEGSFGNGGSASDGVTFVKERCFKNQSAILSGISPSGMGTAIRAIRAATGGAGGSGDNSSAAGGSGGGAAGVLWIAAKNLNGSGTLRARGGDGGDAGGSDAGGGGGGGGGLIYLLSAASAHDFNLETNGGDGGVGGGGSGTNGDNGSGGLSVFRGAL